MINKKAQVSKALTFPIFILVILIMGGFIILASVISLSGPELQQSTKQTPLAENILFQSVEIETNEETKQIILYDALTLLTQSKVTSEQIKNSLDKLQQETGNCYYLSYGDRTLIPTETGGFETEGEGETFLSQPGLENKLTHSKIKLNNQETNIIQYFGPCPGGANE